MKKLSLLAMATLALLATAITSLAQAAPVAPAWTSPGSAGATLDETSQTLYAVNPPDNTCLTFQGAKTGTIQARYDVVNTAVPSTPFPAWNTFELGYIMPAGSTVTAVLYRVFPCTGQRVEICRIPTSITTIPRCDVCTFAPSFNYLAELYMVEVTLTRPAGAPSPSVCTLRVYN